MAKKPSDEVDVVEEAPAGADKGRLERSGTIRAEHDRGRHGHDDDARPERDKGRLEHDAAVVDSDKALAKREPEKDDPARATVGVPDPLIGTDSEDKARESALVEVDPAVVTDNSPRAPFNSVVDKDVVLEGLHSGYPSEEAKALNPLTEPSDPLAGSVAPTNDNLGPREAGPTSAPA